MDDAQFLKKKKNPEKHDNHANGLNRVTVQLLRNVKTKN